MRKTTILLPFLLALLVLLAVGCGNEQKAVEKSAYNYSYAMANYNVDEAEPYATEETRNTTLVLARRLLKAVDSSYIASDTPAKIKILKVDIANDTEAIAVYHKTSPRKDFSDTLYLRKRDGGWYAHVLSAIEPPQNLK